MSNQKRKALGRGLGALLPQSPSEKGKSAKSNRVKESNDSLQKDLIGRELLTVPISKVKPAPFQPRKALNEEALEELTESIKEKGILSPIVVRPDGENFLIIAGERRWRAARRAGLTKIPVLNSETPELEAFELALIENIQREDLSPLDEAESYLYLMNSRGYGQDSVAQKVGKKRSTIANSVRLLRLPDAVKDLLSQGKISTGHARALLSLDDEILMVEVATAIIERGLSVREVEKLAQKKKKKRNLPKKRPRNQQLQAIEDKLRVSLGTKVKLKEAKKGGGTITIDYYTLDQLDNLIDRLIRNLNQDEL